MTDASGSKRRRLKGAIPALALGCVAVLGAFGWLEIQEARLHAAPGPFAVGTASIDVALRPIPGEPLSVDTPRAAPAVQVWYPAPRTVADAPLAPSRSPFPVLVYFPGWEGTRVDNLHLIRLLASNGFVVAAVHYPAPDPAMSAASRGRLIAQLNRQMDFSSAAAGDLAFRRAAERVRARAADASAVLDRLTQLDTHDPAGRFTGRMDLGRVGILGFSLGGAVAAQACWGDARFKAALNMDGWLFADAQVQGIVQPYVVMTGYDSPAAVADLRSPNPWVRLPAQYDALDGSRGDVNFRRHGGYIVVIPGTEHEEFTDAAWRIHLRPLLHAHPLAGRHAALATYAYVLAFFRMTLEGVDSPLLDGDHGIAGGVRVRVRHWPAPPAVQKPGTHIG